VAKVIEDAVAELKKQGAPGGGHQPAPIPSCPSGLLRDRPGRGLTNLSRYDGVRYGHRAAEYKDLVDM
jgi:Asp-tRNA(Asn)/Glu-tRNA(Gln) amidotransferase A subunit family amidase